MRIAARRFRSAPFLAVAVACLALAGAASAGTSPATNGSDVIAGTPRADELNGRKGNDQLQGGRGDDTLVGGKGRDFVNGGAGDDTIRARDGKADAILCGGGRDTVYADRADVVAPNCEVKVGVAGGGPSRPSLAIVIVGGKPRAQVIVTVRTPLVDPDPDGPQVADVNCLWSEVDRNPNDPAPARVQPCTYTYPQATSATLIAFGLGFREFGFQSWGGACAGRENDRTSRCELEVDRDLVVTASYNFPDPTRERRT